MTDRTSIKLHIAGEGKTELGSYAGPRSYWSDLDPGVLKTLFDQLIPAMYETRVVRSTPWRSIRKFSAHTPSSLGHADYRNVLGLMLDARESQCDVLVFSRDQDKDQERSKAILEALKGAVEILGECPQTVGGVAIPAIEGWLLAVLGENKTEGLSAAKAKERLGNVHSIESESGMTDAINESDLENIPADATSPIAWIGRAKRAVENVCGSSPKAP